MKIPILPPTSRLHRTPRMGLAFIGLIAGAVTAWRAGRSPAIRTLLDGVRFKAPGHHAGRIPALRHHRHLANAPSSWPGGRAVPQTPCLYPAVWQVKVMATMVASGLATEMSAPSSPVPLLEPGDRLSREEFERRYERMPDVQK